MRGLSLGDLGGLLEEHARRLLVKDDVHSLEGRERSLLSPPVCDSR